MTQQSRMRLLWIATITFLLIVVLSVVCMECALPATQGRNSRVVRPGMKIATTTQVPKSAATPAHATAKPAAKPAAKVAAKPTKSGTQSARTLRRTPSKPARRRSLPSRGISCTKTFTVEATAYCPCARCCGKSDGITATGMRAGKGVIAVDPRVIPLGSRVYVTGYGAAVAADTGGAIRGNRIDVCFPSHGKALRWGRRTVQITVYASGL